ncbi:MAG TPA: LLM class flavin-dependent oxidoreductase [Xanthobacteraceae bacterium]|jgi:luciferase family oxidoreductase group 1
MIPFSVLDLSPIIAGGTAASAFRNSLDLARHTERLGFHRYWLAEHHNMPGIASAATSVVIGHVAAGTSKIRVGAGGVMLPNHSPLVIAEQFGTLESLHPGRIDLAVGRAPGTDQLTAFALRRDAPVAAERFPQDVVDLLHYFQPVQPKQAVRAYPGAGLQVPVWILGSSLFGAQLAAMLGLPFAFASHFAPDFLLAALEIYRAKFKKTAFIERPIAMAGIGIYAADTEEEARHLFTSVQQQFVNLRRGQPTQLQPPVRSMDGLWSEAERTGVEHAMRYALVGTREQVRDGLQKFIAMTAIDELIIATQIYDHGARKRSYEIVAEVREGLAGV